MRFRCVGHSDVLVVMDCVVYLWIFAFQGRQWGQHGVGTKSGAYIETISLSCHSRHEHLSHSCSRDGVLVHMRHDPAVGVLVS